jgi:hypothetical protein
VDGRQVFIGIVRRRSVLVFFRDRMSAVLHPKPPPPSP